MLCRSKFLVAQHFETVSNVSTASGFGGGKGVPGNEMSGFLLILQTSATFKQHSFLIT